MPASTVRDHLLEPICQCLSRAVGVLGIKLRVALCRFFLRIAREIEKGSGAIQKWLGLPMVLSPIKLGAASSQCLMSLARRSYHGRLADRRPSGAVQYKKFLMRCYATCCCGTEEERPMASDLDLHQLLRAELAYAEDQARAGASLPLFKCRGCFSASPAARGQSAPSPLLEPYAAYVSARQLWPAVPAVPKVQEGVGGGRSGLPDRQAALYLHRHGPRCVPFASWPRGGG